MTCCGMMWFIIPTSGGLLQWHVSSCMVNQVQVKYINHYNDVIIGAKASQITSLTIVYSTVHSGANQRKHQSSASLAFVWSSSVAGEFPAQIASNAENVSIC